MVDFKSLAVMQLSSYWSWMVEQDLTPHLLFRTDLPAVQIPAFLRANPVGILNISNRATGQLMFGPDAITFSARFNQKAQQISIPYEAVLGMRGKELPHEIGVFPIVDFKGLVNTMAAATIGGQEKNEAPPSIEPAPTQPDPPPTARANEPALTTAASSTDNTVVSVDFRQRKRP